MSGHTSLEWQFFFYAALLLVLEAIYFKRQFWDLPLTHGPGFFLGVAVPPKFYDGEGARWLRRYHTVLLLVNLLLGLALLAILLTDRWRLLGMWCPGAVVLQAGASYGFTFYARRTLGASPPVRASVAIPLETRRLGDYISWRSEALIGLLATFCWALLLTNADAQVRWAVPVVISYIIIGLFPFKIEIIRSGFPVPAERPDEHLRWMETLRRYRLYIMDYSRWSAMAILGLYALVHGWRAVRATAWLHWALPGVALAVWIFFTVTLMRRERRVNAMGRDLLPVGSWSTPFRPARVMAPGFAVAFAAWFGGLVLLLVFFRH